MAERLPALDTELEELPPELRWREWMGRIEAVIFASATPVPRADLARVVGQGVQFADAVRAAADVGDKLLDLNEFEVAVLASIAYHQPLTRDGLKDIFGKDISRDLIGRLRAQELITTGPRSPRAGAPYTYVTTTHFLVVFGMGSLRDLPDREELEDAGLAS